MFFRRLHRLLRYRPVPSGQARPEETVDGLCHGVRHPLPPLFRYQEFLIMRIRQIAEFDQNRGHVMRFQNPETG